VVEHLRITRVGHRGDGVTDGAADGADGPIYISGTLPGELVEVADWPGHPDRRILLNVEEASPARIAPICPHFGPCGGCALQHWQRRAVFHARRGTHDVLEVGFSAARAHHLVAIDRCPILAKSLDGALKAAWAIAEVLDASRKPLDIQVTATDAGLDIDVRGSGPLTAGSTAALVRVAAAQNLARLTRHGELVAQTHAPSLRMGGATVILPPAAFLQATAEGEAVLARLVRESCAGAKNIADLFAGVGPFALRLAEQARVFAADADEAAITALKGAAAATAGLKPVLAERRDLFKNPLAAAELKRFDAVVFDPPRQGAQAQAHALAASGVAVVAAVSCNPGTLARDLRILLDGGYRLGTVTPVDQFRYSAHVEIVARLEK
jgi:23S rRNA (uracil1939-C5)-methyltransferase